MKKEDIRLSDWNRILIGDNPAEFLLEVFIRTLLIYLLLLVILRLLGKRMNGQVTNLELAVMLTLGAIVSPAMQLPDRGLLAGATGLVCALGFLRLTNMVGFKSRKAEKKIQGTGTILVRDGLIQLEAMSSNLVSRQQLYAVLRGSNIYNLSKVKRLYLEAYGMFSIFPEEEDRPGLSVLPPTDDEVRGIYRPAESDLLACSRCGQTVPARPAPDLCPNCEASHWQKAVL
ncbi:DUF421 domain-containing protein [Larkinella soli]|uniref:DUF421 domain-containing protein n=1 Tax=Larkinella soli TaxID=1770527 RepID=UPI000FFBC6EE|nr:YetF domain-containing protein [Larkinella soli]